MSGPVTSAAPAAPKRLIGFGHPLLDIISHVDIEYLGRFGIELGSCNLAQPDQLGVFEDLSQHRDVEFVPGGASMNTVRVARWMLGAHPLTDAATCTFVGCLGDDEFGCILERALNRGGVSSHFQRDEELQTGTCAAIIVDKERSLLTNLCAALRLSMDYLLSEDPQRAIAAADIFYFEGFFMNTASSPDNAHHLGKHCVQHNKVFAWNLSAPYLCHIFKERLRDVILPYTDIIFGSRIDATALAEALEWPERELGAIMLRMVEAPKANNKRRRIVVITGGSEATFVAGVEGQIGVLTFTVPPVDITTIVDTNGAGDAFVGGYLSQLMLGRGLEDCVSAGHAAAAEIIRHNGCTFSDQIPTWTAVPGESTFGTIGESK